MESERGFTDGTSDPMQPRQEPFQQYGQDRHGRRNRRNNRRLHGPNNRIAPPEKRARYANEAPCPIHMKGQHTWGMCFLNPNGINYKPQHNAPSVNTGRGIGRAGPNEWFAPQNATIPFALLAPHGRGGGYRGPTHQAFLLTNNPSANGMTHQPYFHPGVAGRMQTIC